MSRIAWVIVIATLAPFHFHGIHGGGFLCAVSMHKGFTDFLHIVPTLFQIPYIVKGFVIAYF
jgi:hypothetical protein